ncbi:hypothetical protein QBC46DRAFT_33999 [Diplogelasinospora grovesii]|uniref:Uncharacterized protein n=1 Tax=Diplogelasinospora grovesii TaxID=303347 RepID=A0AAN6S821_9PEZI|nr:hypothetical protein QBC46DRAFT_33999 [Diplogelasinospora grovesii]
MNRYPLILRFPPRDAFTSIVRSRDNQQSIVSARMLAARIPGASTARLLQVHIRRLSAWVTDKTSTSMRWKATKRKETSNVRITFSYGATVTVGSQSFSFESSHKRLERRRFAHPEAACPSFARSRRGTVLSVLSWAKKRHATDLPGPGFFSLRLRVLVTELHRALAAPPIPRSVGYRWVPVVFSRFFLNSGSWALFFKEHLIERYRKRYQIS